MDAIPEVIRLLGTYGITAVRASIGMHPVCKYIRGHSELRVIPTGEVSDELFGL